VKGKYRHITKEEKCTGLDADVLETLVKRILATTAG